MTIKVEQEIDGKLEVYIPSTRTPKARFGMMIGTALPGVILILAVLSPGQGTPSSTALKIFSFLAGFLVVIASVREYKKPGKSLLVGLDTITVFSGFLLVATGANMFNALKGFQPAHGYFLAGFVSIFKGVMIPEKKMKRGFVVTEEEVKFKGSLFSSEKAFKIKGLTGVNFNQNVIVFKYADGANMELSVKNTGNGQAMTDALNALIFGNEATNKIVVEGENN